MFYCNINHYGKPSQILIGFSSATYSYLLLRGFSRLAVIVILNFEVDHDDLR